MQESMETLTAAVTLLNVFQASIIIFGTTLVLTSDVCSEGKIQTKLFLKEKCIIFLFWMCKKTSLSAAGKTSSCSIALKHILNFRKHLLGKTGYFL